MASNNKSELIGAWKSEYKKQGIPSSFRKNPTRALSEFISWLEKNNFPGKVAADLGCGLGRNSFYLANKGFSVTALDLLQENAEEINLQALSLHLPIRAFGQDVSDKWPIALESLDVAIDIFCYKHIINKDSQKKYRSELCRTLKPNGYYLISLASVDDGFYGPLLVNSPSSEENLIIDPHANIFSYLYSESSLAEEFSDLFNVVEISTQTSLSPMHGKEYVRKVINCIFKKRIF